MNVHLNSMEVEKHTKNVSGEVHGSLTHWFPIPAALSSPGRPPSGRKHPLPPAGGKSTGGLAPLWELRCRGQAGTVSPAAPRLSGSPEEMAAPSPRTTLITQPPLTRLHRLVSRWPLHAPGHSNLSPVEPHSATGKACVPAQGFLEVRPFMVILSWNLETLLPGQDPRAHLRWLEMRAGGVGAMAPRPPSSDRPRGHLPWVDAARAPGCLLTSLLGWDEREAHLCAPEGGRWWQVGKLANGENCAGGRTER